MSRLLRRWFRLDDPDLSYDLPYGLCEAKARVHGPIPYVICGIRTNKKVGQWWACSRHLNLPN